MSDEIPDSARHTDRKDGAADPERRRLLFAGGTTALATSTLAAFAAGVRFLFPNVLYEPPSQFSLGRPQDYPPNSATFVPERRLFVLNEPGGFRAVSAICTHLGCNVNREEGRGYACPCHGSVFDLEGQVVSGPAPWPLPYFALSLSRRGELIVDERETVDSSRRFKA